MSTPEIITVNSEALEAQIRDLLPSQSGFGSELQASNVIMPIIDLTATAEGSGLDTSLQQALSIDGTRFKTATTSANQVVSTITGFVRCFGTFVSMEADSSGSYNPNLYLYDGSTKYSLIDNALISGVTAQTFDTKVLDFVYFAGSGVSLRYDGASFSNIAISTRQIATITGELVNPTGFTAE